MTPVPFVIKICGITNEDDARVAVDAGANALGFNFYPASPRAIVPLGARQIIDAIDKPFLKVGVFVNPSLQQLVEAGARANLDVFQLHGEIYPSRIPQGYKVWRAVSATSAIHDRERADAYVIDAPTPRHGGSGEVFDWSLAAKFPDPKIIAGGLAADNVGAAIEKTRPWGVDACSRLESRPGKKEAGRVRDFVRAALAAFERRKHQSAGT